MDLPDQDLTPEAVLRLWDKRERALGVINQGQRLPLHDRLRQSLQRVAEQAQHALHERVELSVGELAI